MPATAPRNRPQGLYPAAADDRGATFDDSARYRYRLWRRWQEGPLALFVMLNPSTADAQLDDPTVRRCLGFAKAWGMGALEVVNLFAYRATDPRELDHQADPIGPRNDLTIIEAAGRADRIVVAWGALAALPNRIHDRPRQVRRLLLEQAEPHGTELLCLGMTNNHNPKHPLYLKGDTAPTPWRPAWE